MSDRYYCWRSLPFADLCGPAIRSPQSSRAIAASPGAVPGEAAAALKQDMRKLWTDHVVWTRDYIIAAVGDQPDAQSCRESLDEESGRYRQGDRARFYGDAAGQQLTTLLKEHISIAVDLVKAAKAGDKAAQQQADARWQQNAVQIADFLSKANPELAEGHVARSDEDAPVDHDQRGRCAPEQELGRGRSRV